MIRGKMIFGVGDGGRWSFVHVIWPSAVIGHGESGVGEWRVESGLWTVGSEDEMWDVRGRSL